MSYQQQPTNGFTVRTAPSAPQQQGYAPSPSRVGGTGGYQEYMSQNRQASGEDEESVRTSTATRHMFFGMIEISAGIASNFIQIGTTIFSFMQIQLGIKNQVFQRYGMWGGWSYVAANNPAFLWVAIVLAIGAQILLQAGCQILSRSWKKGAAGRTTRPTALRFRPGLAVERSWMVLHGVGLCARCRW